MELFDTCFFCHTPIKEGDNLVAVSHVTCTGYYAIDDDRQLREFQDEIRLPEFDTPYGAVYCYECWDSISAMLGRASECSLNLRTLRNSMYPIDKAIELKDFLKSKEGENQ